MKPALIALLLATPAQADTTLIAVAANFADAASAIGTEFTAATGHEVTFTTGSTGKLYAQIAQGAPFDILLSADAATPERLAAEGLGLPETRFTYAIGHLTLWSADPATIGPDPKTALLSEGTLFIAIANPDLAPYGVAAVEAMQAMGVWDTVQPKIVLGQNIGQTFALVETGAAQVGFIATSALTGSTAGSRLDIPQDLFSPIRQDAILLTPGADNPAAIAFLDYLASDTAKAITKSHGYGTE
ncbi:MAG: molybdate ABC transporter substrate-binding protein [Paracoccaceae bacterium]